MKNLIYPTVFSLFLASITPIALAEDSHDNDETSHIISALAYPRRKRALDATHRFEVHVKGQPISALSVELPERISIEDGIEVTDDSDQKVTAKVAINDQKATLTFAQPIAPDTTLKIKMKGVDASRLIQKIVLYRVNITMVDMSEEISIGVAEIRTN
ncbi:hypothetical protein NIES4102_40850 (plasmid) [Chondrocystis sp. NIES-4102]|nr:hypothetical protein NIES4102_40850 [Chondrocystis sp. NIES-4102]